MNESEKLNGYRMLIYYLKRALPQIREDLELIDAALEKRKS